MDLLQKDFSLFDKLADNQGHVITDTSFIETLVYSSRIGIKMGPGIKSWLQSKRYQAVFFLEPMEEYRETLVRMESNELASQIGQEIKEAYQIHGYNIVMIPLMSLTDRCQFVKNYISQEKYTL